jgi:hypothetical protein
MSEPMPESGGAGNILTRKFAGVPGYIWLIGAAVVVYFFFRNSSANSSGQTASDQGATGDNSGTSDTGDSTVNPPDINVTVNPQPTTPTPTKTTTTSTNAYSWTDEGQKWTVNQLASKLGVSVSALKPANSQASDALKSPTKLIPKGAKFTYTKAPKTITSS